MNSPTGRAGRLCELILGGSPRMVIVDDLWEQPDYAALEIRNIALQGQQEMEMYLYNPKVLVALLSLAVELPEPTQSPPIHIRALQMRESRMPCLDLRGTRISKGERKRNKRDRWS